MQFFFYLVFVLWKGCEDTILFFFRLDFNCLCLVIQVGNVVPSTRSLCIIALYLVCHTSLTVPHPIYHICELLHGISDPCLCYSYSSIPLLIAVNSQHSYQHWPGDIGDGFQFLGIVVVHQPFWSCSKHILEERVNTTWTRRTMFHLGLWCVCVCVFTLSFDGFS